MNDPFQSNVANTTNNILLRITAKLGGQWSKRKTRPQRVSEFTLYGELVDVEPVAKAAGRMDGFATYRALT
jgi:hypothetical protein